MQHFLEEDDDITVSVACESDFVFSCFLSCDTCNHKNAYDILNILNHMTSQS